MSHSTRPQGLLWRWVLGLVIAAGLVCSFILPGRPVDPSLAGPLLPVAGPPSGAERTAAFRFAVCGDNRQGEEIYRQILAQAQADGSAFLINTGDLVNAGTERQFKAFAALMRGFSLPFYPVPGNHDNADGLLTAYLRHSGAPAANYAFDYGLAHFALVDSSLGDVAPSVMAWLAQDLESTRQPLKFVVVHHPPFDPAGTAHIMRRGNTQFMQLMVEKRVDWVLAGHIHSFDHQVRDGVHYLITGGAGAPLYPVPNRPAFHHYVRFSVQGEQVHFEVARVEE